MNGIVKYSLVLVLFYNLLSAQITLTQKVNISEALQNNEASVIVSPQSLAPNINNLFDGEPFTEIGINDGDSIVVTLEFEIPKKITETKAFYLLLGGEWSVETAESMDDLNAMTGTYQSVLENSAYSPFVWDSVSHDGSYIKVIRVTARNLTNNIVHIGELVLEIEKTLTGLYILPSPPRLLPGTELELSAGVIDEENNYYPYDINEPLIWTSSDITVAAFNDENPVLSGVSLGTSIITVRTANGQLIGSVTASVENDFVPEKAETKVVKVAVVYQDPVVSMGQYLHQRFGWNNPRVQMPQIEQEFEAMSGGVIDYQIVEVHDNQTLFTRLDSVFITVSELVSYYQEPNWQTLKTAHQEGRLKFDYRELINHYDFCNKRDQGLINEVWVLAHPYASMYESQLVGANAFWYNSPPIKDAGCDKLLAVMGLNYERTVDLALHSFGHRMESALWQAFGRWDVHNPNPNAWEIFTRIDKEISNGAHVGNIHFPPNGMSDYDYSNSRSVVTYADNWKRYPYLLNQKKTVTCSEWNCTQMGYMRWWFGRIPKFKGVSEGILNNWWHYFIDYEEAVELAGQTPVVKVEENLRGEIPNSIELEQNFPNPFNPVTNIGFSVPEASAVKIEVYNVLGEKIKTLINDRIDEGSYLTKWDGTNSLGSLMPSGVYLYTINIDNKLNHSKKMVLLK